MDAIKLNDKKDLAALREALDAAVKMVAEEHGINGIVKNARYERDGSMVSIGIDFTRVNANGVVETKERNDYLAYAEMEGMKTEWIDKKFSHPQHGAFSIIGYKPRSQKYPVLYNRIGKRAYKASVAQIIQLVGASTEQ